MKRIYLTLLPCLGMAVLLAAGCQEPAGQSTDSGADPPATEQADPPAPKEIAAADNGATESAADTTATTPSTPTPEPPVDPTIVPATVPAEPEPTTEPPADPAPQRPAPPTSLTIGDPHPGLAVAKWVKGEPVSTPLQDKVHVVEFWATWCGPCRVGMPHISELQEKFADDVAFIGVTREDEATVQGFLEKESPQGKTWDEVIQYRLALDENDWTNKAYMQAAGQNGIPCAFIVGRDGVVEWIGHPGTIDEPLQQVVDGTWDREAAIKKMEADKKMRAAMMTINQLARGGKWDEALAELDKVEAELGASETLLGFRWQVLLAADRGDEANEVADRLIKTVWEDSRMLNQVAWGMANNDGDLEIALKAAERASELKEHKDGSTLDTVAFCHYQMGQLDKAIEWQEKAVAADPNPQLQATLQKYKAEKAKPAPEPKETPKEGAEEKAPAKEAAKEAPAKEAAKEAPAKEAAKEAPAKEAAKEAPAKEAAKEAPAKEPAKEAPAEEE